MGLTVESEAINLHEYKYPESAFKTAAQHMDDQNELHSIWKTHTSKLEIKLLLFLLDHRNQNIIKDLINPLVPDDNQLWLLARTVKANEKHFPELAQHVLLVDDDYEFDFSYELLFLHVAMDCRNLPTGYYKNLVLEK